MPLHIDPNGVWSVETAIKVGKRLEPVLEYLEDRCLSIADNAAVRAAVNLPFATNMCAVSFNDVLPAIAAGSVDVVLSDHHFWGGLRRSQVLASIAETFKLGLSMHSNSHLGISSAAMIQLAAATKTSTTPATPLGPGSWQAMMSSSPESWKSTMAPSRFPPSRGLRWDSTKWLWPGCTSNIWIAG